MCVARETSPVPSQMHPRYCLSTVLRSCQLLLQARLLTTPHMHLNPKHSTLLPCKKRMQRNLYRKACLDVQAASPNAAESYQDLPLITHPPIHHTLPDRATHQPLTTIHLLCRCCLCSPGSAPTPGHHGALHAAASKGNPHWRTCGPQALPGGCRHGADGVAGEHIVTLPLLVQYMSFVVHISAYAM